MKVALFDASIGFISMQGLLLSKKRTDSAERSLDRVNHISQIPTFQLLVTTLRPLYSMLSHNCTNYCQENYHLYSPADTFKDLTLSKSNKGHLRQSWASNSLCDLPVITVSCLGRPAWHRADSTDIKVLYLLCRRMAGRNFMFCKTLLDDFMFGH